MIRGKVFYRGRIIEAGIEVEEGRIARIGKLVEGREVRGLILPAAIDVHVHFRDFKEKHKETIESGSLAALHGGVCLVVDQPNTSPVVDSFETYERRMKIAEKRTYVDYSLNVALTKRNVAKIKDIVKKIRSHYHLPAVGEVFLQHSSEELQVSYDELLSVDHLVTVHAEDAAYVSEGFPNFRYRSRRAEIVAVERCLRIGRFHFCHISTPEAASLISLSPSTFEVTPHHLLFSEDDFERLNGLVNVNPPLRRRSDAEWLLENLDMADVLASDHAPHTIEEKLDGASGFPGVETMYPIFVRLAFDGIIDLRTLVEKIAANPAKIFGFKGYGEIEVGNYANLAIFDPRRVERIEASKLHSLCGWTPFEGFEAVFPTQVYLRGVEVLSCEEKLGRVLKV